MKSCRLFLVPIVACLIAGGSASKAFAQSETPVLVRGQITDPIKKTVLYPATVRNKNTNAKAFSDNGGYYRINASKGDLIIVSFIGYVSDSFTVTNYAGTQVNDVRLREQERFLPSVEVSGKWSPYQLDSLARAEEFKPFLETENRSLVDKSKRGPGQGGFGIVFSPFSRYSQKEKDLRKFKKLYDEYNRQSYVDYRYSKAFVTRVTGLVGDSLLQFIYKYTPSHDLLRNMTNETLIYWTAERAKLWRRDPKATLKEDQ
ncbi:carboxypeptidase-like regulatory domain-containing protein [Chitinophaga niabensis]|uniref:carboxypeptidase-like regulatory domain-containing protein n=1 Tax=Chitinophaga niabensis TaxID=536979 RepID=UPI0031BB5330